MAIRTPLGSTCLRNSFLRDPVRARQVSRTRPAVLEAHAKPRSRTVAMLERRGPVRLRWRAPQTDHARAEDRVLVRAGQLLGGASPGAAVGGDVERAARRGGLGWRWRGEHGHG